MEHLAIKVVMIPSMTKVLSTVTPIQSLTWLKQEEKESLESETHGMLRGIMETTLTWLPVMEMSHFQSGGYKNLDQKEQGMEQMMDYSG